MNIFETPIQGLLMIEPLVFNDQRGYFFESFNQNKFDDNGLNYTFVQDNESLSGYGVIRGLHYQLEPYAQTKLVRVIKGRIFDVAVDLREWSETFGKWYGVELSEENKRQFLIPKGFAHGFSVLSDVAIFAYKCDNFFHQLSERGIQFDDQDLNIDWRVDKDKIKVSDRDLKNPTFKNSENNFIRTI